MDLETRELLTEIRQDIKDLLPVVQMVDRHEMLLYGDGQRTGLLRDVDHLQETVSIHHKRDKALFTSIGAILTFVTGNAVWRWITLHFGVK